MSRFAYQLKPQTYYLMRKEFVEDKLPRYTKNIFHFKFSFLQRLSQPKLLSFLFRLIFLISELNKCKRNYTSCNKIKA